MRESVHEVSRKRYPLPSNLFSLSMNFETNESSFYFFYSALFAIITLRGAKKFKSVSKSINFAFLLQMSII